MRGNSVKKMAAGGGPAALGVVEGTKILDAADIVIVQQIEPFVKRHDDLLEKENRQRAAWLAANGNTADEVAQLRRAFLNTQAQRWELQRAALGGDV